MSLNQKLFNVIISNSENKFKQVKKLIEEGANINAHDQEGNTPLLAILNKHFAKTTILTEDDIAIIKHLVEAGADLNAQDSNGNSCLHHLLLTQVKNDSAQLLELIIYFLKHPQIQINITNKLDENPLLYFIKCTKNPQTEDIVRLLLTYKADIHAINKHKEGFLDIICSNFQYSSYKIDIPTGFALIKLALEHNIPVTPPSFSQNKNTPLLLSIQSNIKEYVQLLLENNATVTFACVEAAMKQAHIMVYKDFHWTYSAKDKHHKENHEELLTILDLCLHKYSFNSEIEKEKKLIIFAVKNMYPDICIRIFKRAKAIFETNKPLLDFCIATSIKDGKQAVLEYFISTYKINFKEWRYKDKSALELPLHMETVEFLYNQGADINAVNLKSGDTPLHIAAARHFKFAIPLIDFLIKHGADTSLLNHEGKSYIDIILTTTGETRKQFLISEIQKLITQKDYNKIFEALTKYHHQITLEQQKHQELYKPKEKPVPPWIKRLSNKTNKKQRDYTKETLLHVALQDGFDEAIPYLFESKQFLEQIDINASDLHGNTALHVAISLSNEMAVITLLEQSANPNILNNDSLSALELATVEERFQIIKHLLRFNPNMNQKDSEGNIKTSLLALQRISKELDVQINIKDPPSYITSSDHLLLWAVKHGCSKIAKILIEHHSANINFKDNRGITILHYAAKRLLVDLCEYLVTSGVDLTAIDIDGNTALHHLIKISKTDSVTISGDKFEKTKTIAKLLIEAGVNLRQKNYLGHNLLNCGTYNIDEFIADYERELTSKLLDAIRAGDIVAVEDNLKKGANPNGAEYSDPAFYWAIASKNPKMVELLIQYGADINALNLVWKYSATGNSTQISYIPIHTCILQDNVEALKLLIQAGVNLEIKDHNGFTPVQLVTIIKQQPNTKIISTLIGREINNRIERFLAAISKNEYAVIEKLISQGFNVNKLTPYKMQNSPIIHNFSSLHVFLYQLQNNNCEIINFLIRKGYQVNLQASTGDTALHVAAKKNILNAIKILINAGANLNSFNSDHQTPLSLTSNHMEAYTLLLAHHIGVNFSSRIDFSLINFSRAILIGSSIGGNPITLSLINKHHGDKIDVLILNSNDLKKAIINDRFTYEEIKDLYDYLSKILKWLKILEEKNPADQNEANRLAGAHLYHLLKKPEQRQDIFDAFLFLNEIFEQKKNYLKLKHSELLCYLGLLNIPAPIDEYQGCGQGFKDPITEEPSLKRFLAKYIDKNNQLEVEEFPDKDSGYTKVKATKTNHIYDLHNYNWTFFRNSPPPRLFDKKIQKNGGNINNPEAEKNLELEASLLSHPCHQSLEDFLSPAQRRAAIEILLLHPKAIDFLQSLLSDSLASKEYGPCKLDSSFEKNIKEVLHICRYKKFENLDLAMPNSPSLTTKRLAL